MPFSRPPRSHRRRQPVRQPDGATADVKVPQNSVAEGIKTADVAEAHVTLPEGMTLKPLRGARSGGLHPGAGGVDERAPGVRPTRPSPAPRPPIAPSRSKPTCRRARSPAAFISATRPAPRSPAPYTIYRRRGERYGVSVRLRGRANPNPTNGPTRSELHRKPPAAVQRTDRQVRRGPEAPLANPLTCATARRSKRLLHAVHRPGACTALDAVRAPAGAPRRCPSPRARAHRTDSARRRGRTPPTLRARARSDGQQYLSQVSDQLPAGLSARSRRCRCAGTAGCRGTCPSASEIGTARCPPARAPTVRVQRAVYLTGPYGGAPFGLSIWSRGRRPVRPRQRRHAGRVGVDRTAAACVPGTLPRSSRACRCACRSVSVAVNRPTSCSTRPTAARSQPNRRSPARPGRRPRRGASEPLPGRADCDALPFTPTFTASTARRPRKRTGRASR